MHYQGKYGEVIKIGEIAYQESLKQNKPLLAIDALYINFWGHYLLNRVFEVRSYVNLCEELLKSTVHEQQSEIEQRESYFYFIKGQFKQINGEIDAAIKNYRSAFKISKNHDLLYYSKPIFLDFLGRALTTKGEYGLALNSFNEALGYLKGTSILVRMLEAGLLRDIAYIKGMQGDLESSKTLSEKSLEIMLKSSETPMAYIGLNYSILIRICLEQNYVEQAKDYLHKYQKYNDKHPLLGNKINYKLLQAQILKSSTRIYDWIEAMTILKGLISENAYFIFNYDIYAIIELCDLYLRELQITNDPKILDDCQPLIEKLLEITQNSRIYFNAYANLLQGKISLLQMNLGDARRSLANAQDTAEKHGLQLLAQEVSKEHDKLLEQLGEWEDLKKRKAPYADRMNMALLEETLKGMKGNRGVQPPKLENEEPLLLSIITEGGVLLFSYAFTEDWKRDNELFGSFLTAFSSFSDEFFSAGLDRAKFGKYTVLLNSIKNFSICFLFTGQSYQAKQKLARFVDHLKEDTTIQDALDKFYETSQVLELHNFPFLKSLINEILLRVR